MATSQAEASSKRPVDLSALLSPTDSNRSTPRIQIYKAGDLDSISSGPIILTDQRAGADWEEDTAETHRRPNYVFSHVQPRSNPRATSSGDTQSQEDGVSSGQSITPVTEDSRRDSLFKPSTSSDRNNNSIDHSLDLLDTTPGAQSVDENERVVKIRRSLTFFHKSDDAEVRSPVDDSAKEEAEPSAESEDDILLSANTSFDSNESSQEENRAITRPYTSSLDPPPRWDHGPSPEPSEIVSDAGDQQELQLRHRQDLTQDLDARRRIEESLASLPPSDFYDDLQTRIHAAFQSTRKEQGEFLPKGLLCTLINTQSVAQELDQQLSDIHTPEEISRYAERICSETEVERRGKLKIKSFRKIFALLVLVEATKFILQFLEEDVSDIDLPLTLVKYKGIDGLCRRNTTGQDAGEPLKCLRRPKWSTTKLRLFEYYQWKVLAPFFFQDENGDVKHYKLNDQHILPFMALDDMAEEDAEREGGFGRVQMVGIHPDHHNFRAEKSCGRGFAVKQQIYEEHRDSFKKEIIILKKFSGVRSHPHVVSLLATYEQFKKFHLIFYRAEGDLFTYWKELRSQPKINQRNVLWVAEQCRGIVDGLLKLHRLLTLPKSQGGAQEEPTQAIRAPSDQEQPRTQKGKGVTFSNYIQERVRTDSWERPASPICTSNQPRSPFEVHHKSIHDAEREDESHAKKYGRHGDINPGNILWFDDGPEGNEILTGTLKLADFGQAELNSLLSRTKPRSVANTLTYRPPECDLQDKTIRQSYDIWCLGCVLLEFVAWMLGGKDLMEKFSFKRLAPDVFQFNKKTDTFFQVVTNALTLATEVMVKKSVTDFIDELHKHAMCSDYFHELLDMIQHEMLVIDSSERKSCEGIWKCLDDMYQKCLGDRDYAASGNPWSFEGDSIPHSVGFDKLNVSEKALEKLLALRPRHYVRSTRRRNPERIERRTAR